MVRLARWLDRRRFAASPDCRTRSGRTIVAPRPDDFSATAGNHSLRAAQRLLRLHLARTAAERAPTAASTQRAARELPAHAESSCPSLWIILLGIDAIAARKERAEHAASIPQLIST